MKDLSEKEIISIRDLWLLIIGNWYWFALSLFIALSVATVYITITPPVYTRTASLLIKDDKSISENTAEFADLGLFKSNTNISNEILTLKSPLLMAEVVQRLKLNQNYSLKGRFREQVLYTKTPIVVLLDSVMEDQSFSCTIKLLPENRALLSGFSLNGAQSEGIAVEGNLSEPLATPYGNIIVLPTSFYSESYYNTEIIYSKARLRQVANAYVSALSVALSDKTTTIVALSINDVSPQRAEDILGTLIAVYNENWVEDRNQIAVSTSLFINERLNVIESELGGVDDNISQFKSKNLLPDVQAASSMYMARSNENNTQILALNTQRTIAEYVRNSLKEPNAKEQLLPSNMGLEGAGIEGQIQEYNTMVLRRNTLLANSSESNPLIVDLNQSLESVRDAISNSIDNLLITLDTRIKDISRSEQRTNQRIASNPEQAKYLLSVERQQKIKEVLYLFLLQKREENKLSQAFTTYNTKIISPPSGSSFPTAPRRSNVLLMAFAIGALLPLVILFLLENMNTTVRGRKDLDGLMIPFIGEIPQMQGRKKKQQSQSNIVVQENARDYMNEAFRVVRTNLDFMKGVSEQAKVVMVTSFNVGAGKTFTTTNLAISMALRGRKVIAVDLDMRKASLSKTVALPPQTGIANYLGNFIADPQEMIVKGKLHPNLDVIPVGTIPPNPTELLLDKRLDDLLELLRKQYDYIFLDCPPVEIVADAAIIEKLADISLFVIRAGLMDRRILPEVKKFYEEKTFKNMAMLLNGCVFKTGEYGHRRYGYHYGHHYGYGG